MVIRAGEGKKQGRKGERQEEEEGKRYVQVQHPIRTTTKPLSYLLT